MLMVFIMKIKMTENKQSSVYYLIEEYEKTFGRNIDLIMSYANIKAKQQHKKESIVFALLCMMPNMEPDKSTIEVVSDIYDEYFGGDV